MLKQIPACQVLQPLLRVGYGSRQESFLKEERFWLCYLPYSKAGGLVNILLKKQRHCKALAAADAFNCNLVTAPVVFSGRQR